MRCTCGNSKVIPYDTEYRVRDHRGFERKAVIPTWWCTGCLTHVRSDVSELIHYDIYYGYKVSRLLAEDTVDKATHLFLEEGTHL